MAGNRMVTEVVVVGPREGFTGELLGFKFEGGVAQVPTASTTALYMLGKYHNAFPKDSREHEEAERQWTKALVTAGEKAAGAADPKLAVALEDAKSHIDSQQAELERLRAELREAKAASAESAKAQATTDLAKAPAEETLAADSKAKGKGKGKE